MPGEVTQLNVGGGKVGLLGLNEIFEEVQKLSQLDLAADVEHVRDLNRIGEFGLVATPALVINNKVKASGRAPAKSKLKEMIAAEANNPKKLIEFRTNLTRKGVQFAKLVCLFLSQGVNCIALARTSPVG